MPVEIYETNIFAVTIMSGYGRFESDPFVLLLYLLKPFVRFNGITNLVPFRPEAKKKNPQKRNRCFAFNENELLHISVFDFNERIEKPINYY